MYAIDFEFHDLAARSQGLGLKSDREEFDQDIFDYLDLEIDVQTDHVSPQNQDNIGVPRSSSLPDQLVQLPHSLECADNLPNANANVSYLHNRELEGPNSMLRGVEGRRLQIETPLTAGVVPREVFCQEPINLTRLLKRCEDDLELLTEVSFSLMPSRSLLPKQEIVNHCKHKTSSILPSPPTPPEPNYYEP